MQRFFKNSLTVILISIFAATAVNAQTGIQKVTSVEGITEYRLPNGLKVLLFTDQTKQNITVSVVYLVGSRHENYGETGMAHLLEHLLFKGTPKHPNIPAEMTAHGAGANGSTLYDRTDYFESFPASEENLEWALDLEADRMVNSFIAKKDLESEFSVVRNEMESRENNPRTILTQKVIATSYEWHNYGNGPIGARSDVENVPIDRLQAFYKKYYQPDNAVLIVAGKFDEAKTLSLINQKFGSIPKPTRELPKIYTVEPVQDGARQVTVNRVGDTQYVMAAYHIAPGAHPDSAAVNIMTGILTDAPSGRLYKTLVETKKATNVFNVGSRHKEPGIVIFGAQLDKTASADAARDTLIQTLESFAQTPPTEEEVNRVRDAALKTIERSFNESIVFPLQLSDWIARGDWRLFFLHRDRLKRVTPEDVQRVARNYLKQSNRTLGIFSPTEKPDRAEIPQLTDEQISAMVEGYKGGETVAAGEAFDPSPANIEARTKRTQIGGLKVGLLPKENRGDTVYAELNLHFGDAKILMNRGTAGAFAGQMLMRGSAKRTRQQINDEIDRLKARVVVSGWATGASARIGTTRKNLAEALKIAAEILREPAFPQADFDQLKQERLTQLESQRSEPGSVASYAMDRHFNRYTKGDVRYSPTLEEQIADVKALSLEDVKKFYKDFYGASVGELAIVGDFDEKEITPLVNQLFGGWKSPSPYQRVPYEYFDIPAVNKSLETPDKANASFRARLDIKMSDDHPDYPSMVIGNFMLGGGFLNSRLATRIRQKEGLSYGVSSSFTADSLDETATFFANAIHAPQNAEKLEAAFKEEIHKVVTEGFTAEEVEQAKKGWLLKQQTGRVLDNTLGGTLANYLFVNRTFSWNTEIEKKVQSLTPVQINAAMKRHLTPEKISIFKAGDFAGAKAKALQK